MGLHSIYGPMGWPYIPWNRERGNLGRGLLVLYFFKLSWNPVRIFVKFYFVYNRVTFPSTSKPENCWNG